jgi:Flp pilus assembly protein TadG
MNSRESKNMKFHRLASRATVHRRAPAQSMVEFALVAMILFLMLFGIFEISRLVFTINSVNNGAREGSHWAALHPSATANDVKQAISPTLFLVNVNDASNFALTVVTDTTCTAPCSYSPVTVTVRNTLHLAVPFPGVGSSVVITSASTALTER